MISIRIHHPVALEVETQELFCKEEGKLVQGDGEECGKGKGGLLGEDKGENWNIFCCQKLAVSLHWGKEVGVPEMWQKYNERICKLSQTHRCPSNVPDRPLLCFLDQRMANTFLGLL